MKIAFLSFYGGLNERGVETYVEEISTRLVNLGHDVTVYQNGASRKKTNYRVAYLPSLFLLPPFDSDPDVLIPTNGRLQSVTARAWSLWHRKKYLAVGQSGLGADDKLNLFTFPDVFIGLTDYQCRWARQVNSLVRTARISNGVNTQKFSPDVTPFAFNLPKPLVLSVAAFESIKRLDLLIAAVAKTPFSLALVGRGSLQTELDQLGQRLLGPGRFRILSLPQDQLPAAYTAADVFAYPTSPWESFGIVMLEALSANRPVVATADPIRQEILDTAGLTADPASPDAFAAALQSAVKTDWGDRPRTRAGQFTWDEAASRYHTLLSKL
jgi:glycosyltransferase involved in cell wall biosynthesis